RAVLGVLADGLVIEDDAGNIFRHRLLGAEQHLAVVAPAVGGRFHAERVKTLLDGAGGFIGGQDAAPGGDHGLRDLVQFRNVHRALLQKFTPDWSRLLFATYDSLSPEGRGWGEGVRTSEQKLGLPNPLILSFSPLG